MSDDLLYERSRDFKSEVSDIIDEETSKPSRRHSDDEMDISEWLYQIYENKDIKKYEREGNRLFLHLQNRLKNKISERYLLEKSQKLKRIAESIKSEYEEEIRNAKGDKELIGNIYSKIDKRISKELKEEAFLLVAEALYYQKGFVMTKAQFQSALILSDGDIAELRCGGGKTIMQLMTAYLNTLIYNHHYIFTPNEFLKREGYNEANGILSLLGVNVGVMPDRAGDPKNEREEIRDTLKNSVIYTTCDNIVFPKLRDRNINPKERIFSEDDYDSCSIDEIDEILLDAVTTPFILSELVDNDGDNYELNLAIKAKEVVDKMTSSIETETTIERIAKGTVAKDKLSTNTYDADYGEYIADYVYDRRGNSYVITESGDDFIERMIERDNYLRSLSPEKKQEFYGYVSRAVYAKIKNNPKNPIFGITKEGKLVPLDENTRRLKETSSFSDIQLALEVEFGLKKLSDTTVTKDKMTIKNLMDGFVKLSGCSGTARSIREYISKRFDMSVTPVKSDSQLLLHEPVFFINGKDKHRYICNQILEIRRKNPSQPILLSASTVKEAEEIAEQLGYLGLDPSVLTHNNTDKEIEIIAQAGLPGSITISSGLTGRGTDIKLGGNLSDIALAILKRKYIGKVSTEELDKYIELIRSNDPKFMRLEDNYFLNDYKEFIKKNKKKFDEYRQEVISSGGLCVISADYLNSKRNRLQILSRAGRGKEPGVAYEFIALNDPLIENDMVNYKLHSHDYKQSVAEQLEREGLKFNEPIKCTGKTKKLWEKLYFDFNKARNNSDATKESTLLQEDDSAYLTESVCEGLRKIRDELVLSDDKKGAIESFILSNIETIIESLREEYNKMDIEAFEEKYPYVDTNLLFNPNFTITFGEQLIIKMKLSSQNLNRVAELIYDRLTRNIGLLLDEDSKIDFTTRLGNVDRPIYSYQRLLEEQSKMELADAALYAIDYCTNKKEEVKTVEDNSGNRNKAFKDNCRLLISEYMLYTRIRNEKKHRGCLTYREKEAIERNMSLKDVTKEKDMLLSKEEIDKARELREFLSSEGFIIADKLSNIDLLELCSFLLCMNKNEVDTIDKKQYVNKGKQYPVDYFKRIVGRALYNSTEDYALVYAEKKLADKGSIILKNIIKEKNNLEIIQNIYNKTSSKIDDNYKTR